ncbi:MAG TPA: TlpA disulfide reductase family protein [Pyrinomonadaceae bacterium]|nr:TlpA disulfide reductase family protein [Pyrinomonadaceae bacterium]
MSAEKQVRETSRLWTPARVAATIVVLSLVAMFGVSSCHSTDESASKETTPAAKTSPAKPANPAVAMNTLPPTVLDAQLKAVNGGPIKLADYNGKVLVVNLWATWCGPCRSEIPELVKLYQEFRPQGLEVVGLSTENPEASAEGVRRFVSDYSMNYRVGWATSDVALTLMNNRNAIPQSFVISRDGRVLTRFVGYNASETPLKLRKAVEEALNDKGKI